jgi:radical SAM protein with 4Fe4S-binding SPASM domain
MRGSIVSDRYIPINKGNYSMDTPEREALFQENLGSAWPENYRAYRQNWEDYAKRQFVSDYPLLVDIELSSICNLRCPMCYTITSAFAEQVHTKRMDWDLITRILDEIGGKVPAIRLSLRGEATLNKNFVECIRYAKAKGIKEVSTLTHGFKLTIPFFQQIAEAGIDWITVSVDGTGETYNKIRAPIKFDVLLQKLKDIKKFKDEHGLKRPVIKAQGIWPAIAENPTLYYETLSPYVDLVAFNPLIDYLGNDAEESISYIENFSCPQQYQRLVIGADGLVMKCSNDEENREIIGDAKVESVYEIWHGAKMQAMRDLQKRHGFKESPVCRKCYLPRKTTDEIASCGGRKFIVQNYVNRAQVVGK